MAPFSREISPKTLPSCLQGALGRPSLAPIDDPGATQEAPKMRQESPKSCPRAVQEATPSRIERRHATKQPQTPSRPRFRTVFGTIYKKNWDHFRWICGSIVKQIGPMFTQLSTRVLKIKNLTRYDPCLLYTSPSPRDRG